MKKIIFLVMSLLLISSVSALSIGSIRYFEDIFLINVYNDEADDLEDVRVKITIIDDEMNRYPSRSFDLDTKENKGTYIIIDEPLARETLVKITVRNDDTRRVKYLII